MFLLGPLSKHGTQVERKYLSINYSFKIKSADLLINTNQTLREHFK